MIAEAVHGTGVTSQRSYHFLDQQAALTKPSAYVRLELSVQRRQPMCAAV